MVARSGTLTAFRGGLAAFVTTPSGVNPRASICVSLERRNQSPTVTLPNCRAFGGMARAGVPLSFY